MDVDKGERCDLIICDEKLHSTTEETTPRPMIKEEDFYNNYMVHFPSSTNFNYQQNGSSFEVVDGYENTVSIPDTPNYSMQFSDEQMNQFFMGTAVTGDDQTTKIPLDLTQMINGMKTEPSLHGQHNVKYRADENGKPIKIWQCSICHKEFGHQYILMRHLPTHTDERKFQCKQCGKAFRQMSTLSQHRAIHSKLRPYVCEVCQKTFNRVSTLISHRKTHTDVKPHRCHLCNKAFHQKGNLRNHIFTHTNERPYKCDVCNKGFNQMSNLMCHKLKAHQRADKPKYHCPLCSKEFEKRVGLRNHEQYEHGELGNSAASIASPSIKYTNGVLVSPINTAAMRLAIATNQVPFALLIPSNGIPVLVRVLSAGDKEMLVPATAEDIKKFGKISIKTETEEEDEKKDKDNDNENSISITNDVAPPPDVANKDTTNNEEDKKSGATVQIRIPVVATVVQRCRDGVMHMDIESPGPKRIGQEEAFTFTTTNNVYNQTEVKSENPVLGAGMLLHDDTLEGGEPNIHFYDLNKSDSEVATIITAPVIDAQESSVDEDDGDVPIILEVGENITITEEDNEEELVAIVDMDTEKCEINARLTHDSLNDEMADDSEEHEITVD